MATHSEEYNAGFAHGRDVGLATAHIEDGYMLEALKRVQDRLSAWRDGAHIAFQGSGSEDQYNLRGNYDALLSFIEPAIRQAERFR